MFSRIALVVAVAFQMTAWAGNNAPINRLPRPGAAVAFQENVPINRLPSPVTAAIKNRFPKSELLSAEAYKAWHMQYVIFGVRAFMVLAAVALI
jgi:hypothetical protein